MALAEVSKPKDMREFLTEILDNINTNYKVKKIGLSFSDVLHNANKNTILVRAFYNGFFMGGGIDIMTLKTPKIITFEIFAVEGSTTDAIERQDKLEQLCDKIQEQLVLNGIEIIDGYEPSEVETNANKFLTLYLLAGKVYV